MKKILLLSIIMLSGIFLYAQDETVIDIQSQRGPYITNGFFDNWFISAAGGVQIYYGENDWHGSFGKRLAPAMDISLGKWITPSTGVRLQYSGLQAKGWNFGESPYSHGKPDGNFYREKFNVMNLHADFLWNISNAIGGYRDDRFWDVIPYVGFGWARSAANDIHKNELAATVGILNTWRISDALDFNLEAKLMMVNERFDYVVRGKAFEGMATLTAGLTYNFPARTFKRASDIIVIEDNTQYINTINDLERQLAKARAAHDAMQSELAAERERIPEVVTEPYPVMPDLAIFFQIGKAKITDKEMINLGYIADVIKQVPDKKFILFASADKETGTPDFNQKLSEKRGKAVYDILTEKYGVNPEQLTIEAVGSSDQRFDGASFNRVVIIEDVEM